MCHCMHLPAHMCMLFVLLQQIQIQMLQTCKQTHRACGAGSIICCHMSCCYMPTPTGSVHVRTSVCIDSHSCQWS